MIVIIVGNTINEALATTIMADKGNETKYKWVGLDYDKKKNFITINDTINETIKRELRKEHAKKTIFSRMTNSQKTSGDRNGNSSDNVNRQSFYKNNKNLNTYL